jgi:hypothetical protein
MHRRFLFLLSLLLLGTIVWQGPSAQSEAPTLSPDSFTISNGQFGLAFVNSAESPRSGSRIARGVSTGAQLDRFPLYWNFIEPSNNQWNWGGQDAALAANEAQGMGTLAILLGTSPAHYPREVGISNVVPMPTVGGGPLREEWSDDIIGAGGTRLNNGCTVQGTPAPAGLFNPIFNNGSDTPNGGGANDGNPWARFVDNTVQRYKPGGEAGRNVRYWEIWNEPDLCHFWGGTPEEYARMLKVAYLVIKNRDPQATVIWGGLAIHGEKYQNGRNFLTEFVNAIRNDPMAAQYNGFFDAATQHQYSNVVHGYNYAVKIKQALAGSGWENKPIWTTESGVPVCDDYPGPACPSPYRGNPLHQASYIWQNIAYTRIGKANGPIFHFMLHDDSGNGCTNPGDAFGIYRNEPENGCNPGNSEARIGVSAFRLANQYLSDVQLVWADIQDGKVRRVAFYDPVTQERRLLTWAIGGQDANAIIPAAGSSARRIYLDGSETTISPSNGVYSIPVSRATNQSQPNSATYTIGGPPYLLVERDTLPPQGAILNLPAVSTSPFNVTWQVSDYGSPIQNGSVTIWVRVNNGDWSQWRTGQNASGNGYFEGDVDSRYQFGITATDQAGNNAGSPSVLAETLVSDETTLMTAYGIVRNVRGQLVPSATVNVGPMNTLSTWNGQFSIGVPVGQWDVNVNGQTVIEGQNHLQTNFFDLLLPPANNAVTNGWFEQVDGGGTITGWSKSGSSPLGVEELAGTRDNVLHLATAFVADPFVPGTEGSNGGNSTISQNLTVPTGNPYLAFRWSVDTEETDGTNNSCNTPEDLHDKFEIIVIANNQAHYLHCQESAQGWYNAFTPLSQFAGQNITLIFNMYESSPNRRTSVKIDQVMIGEAAPVPEIQLQYLPQVSGLP